MDNKIPIIIDCDPGHDDAIALIMAFASEKLKVLGVSVSAGNQTVEKTYTNARKIISFLGKAPPLAKGASYPLVRRLEVAPSVHGESGLDGPVLPETDFTGVPESAWELHRRLISESSEPVTFVVTGPLTNLAILLLAYPDVKKNLKQICLMGGGIDHGNWSSAAEFNILVDPEAAHIVFSCGIPIVMCGLDVTEKAMIFSEEIERLRKSEKRVAVLVAELLDFFGRFHSDLGFEGAPIHDACTIAYLIKPELFKVCDYYVVIETQGKYTAGMTLADKRVNNNRPEPNVTACMDIDREGFVRLLEQCCMAYT